MFSRDDSPNVTGAVLPLCLSLNTSFPVVALVKACAALSTKRLCARANHVSLYPYLRQKDHCSGPWILSLEWVDQTVPVLNSLVIQLFINRVGDWMLALAISHNVWNQKVLSLGHCSRKPGNYKNGPSYVWKQNS